MKYKVDGQQVCVDTKNGEIILQVLTEKIIRIFNPTWMKDYKSVAIEGDKSQLTSFNIKEDATGLVLTTSLISLSIGEQGELEIQDKNGQVILKSYDGKRKIQPRISEKDKRLLESEGHNFASLDEHNYPVQILFDLSENDCFYGLGDKTGFLNKRGFQFENWNSDIPDIHHENMPALYKSIPFLIGKKDFTTFGLFFDNTFHSYINLGKESTDYFYYGADDGNLDIYFIYGPTMAQVISDYTYLTGRAELPTLWSLGYHQCRWGYQSAKDITEVAEKMRQYRIPCESVQYDIDYMQGYRVFTWDEEAYGKKGQVIENLRAQGFKPVVIIDPGVKKESGYFMYDQGIENDYFAHGSDGQVYENAVWPGDAVYPDFGNEKVRKWWGQSHKVLTDMGIEAVWNDMNEPASFKGPLPLDVQFSVDDRKTTHAEAHNTYGHYMSMATNKGLKELTDKRPLVITRAAYAGTQKYSAVWTGDNQSVWSHLRMLIPQLCNLGMSGFSLAGTDIGGFGGDTNPELMARWIEAAAFSTFFRNHSAKGTKSQEPWQFESKIIDIYRKYVELHYQFIPYIYDLLWQSQETGLPVMRPLVLHYEDDENTYNLNDEFLVGENMLVAPVVEQGATKRMVYLPKGNWIDYWTKEKLTGGRYFIVDAPLDKLPIFIKENSIIPTYEVVQYVGEKEYKKLVLISTGTEGKWVHYQDNGSDFAYKDGQYNLYEFTMKDEKSVDVTMVHSGYQEYESIEVVKM